MEHIALRPEWTAYQLAQTQNSTPSDLLATALCSDFHTIAAPSLPPDLVSWPSGTLQGCLVLQVDEIVNISAPARERYAPTPLSVHACSSCTMLNRYSTTHARDNARTLKLLLTDGMVFVHASTCRTITLALGHQQAPALELQHCPQLHADLHAGCKVSCVIHAVCVHTTR